MVTSRLSRYHKAPVELIIYPFSLMGKLMNYENFLIIFSTRPSVLNSLDSGSNFNTIRVPRSKSKLFTSETS